MSMVLPYSPEQVAAWRRRDEDEMEPLTLQLPGFSVTERAGLPNQRVFIYERGNEHVEVTRHWDRPLLSSHPIAIISTRKVTTSGGDTLEVHTASPFEWFPRPVEVVFVNGASFASRVVFVNCERATVDAALARLSIRLGDSTDKHSGPYR
jgi:hypothetical protein